MNYTKPAAPPQVGRQQRQISGFMRHVPNAAESEQLLTSSQRHSIVKRIEKLHTEVRHVADIARDKRHAVAQCGGGDL